MQVIYDLLKQLAGARILNGLNLVQHSAHFTIIAFFFIYATLLIVAILQIIRVFLVKGVAAAGYAACSAISRGLVFRLVLFYFIIVALVLRASILPVGVQLFGHVFVSTRSVGFAFINIFIFLWCFSVDNQVTRFYTEASIAALSYKIILFFIMCIM